MATPPDDMNDDGLESGWAFKPAIPIDVEIAMRKIGGWGVRRKFEGLESMSFVLVSERLCTVCDPLIEARAMGVWCLGASVPQCLRLAILVLRLPYI